MIIAAAGTLYFNATHVPEQVRPIALAVPVAVITGDVTQVDLPREQASGLIQVRDILDSLDGIGFVEFGHADVVRHKLVQRIVEAYKRHAEETGSARRR